MSSYSDPMVSLASEKSEIHRSVFSFYSLNHENIQLYILFKMLLLTTNEEFLSHLNELKIVT